MFKRGLMLFHPDEPPAGAPAAPAAPAAAPAAPVAPAVAPAAPGVAPAAPAGAPAAPAADDWSTTFGKYKPQDVVTALQKLHTENVRLATELRGRGNAPGAPAAPVAPAEPALKDMIFEDPEKALDSYFNRRVAPLAEQFIDHASKTTRTLISQQRDDKGELAMPLFKRFEREIDEFVSRVDARLRTSPETWQSAYNFVVGQHHNELMAEVRASAAPAIERGGGGPASSPEDLGLTKDELAAATAMGMTPKEYKEAKEL